MNRQPKSKTTKVGAGTKDVDLNTASPTGHEEIEAHIAAESKRDAERSPSAPKPSEEKPKSA